MATNSQMSVVETEDSTSQQINTNSLDNNELISKIKTEKVLDDYIIQNKDFLNKYTQPKKSNEKKCMY